jgi:hypothetical protein
MMSEDKSILLERSHQLREHLSGLLGALHKQPPESAEVTVDPMQGLMQGPGKDSFLGIVKLVTFSLVQKLIPYMPKDPVDTGLLELEHARITLLGESRTVFHLKPGKLIATWVNEKGQFKVDDLKFQLSWWWVLLNFKTALDLRKRFTGSNGNAPESVNG